MIDAILDLARRMGVDPALILAQAVNFCIVAFLLYRFAFKKVLQTMDERRDKIEAGLKYAEEMKEKLAEAGRQQQDIVRKAQQEAQQIVAEARSSAKDFYDRQTQETAAKVEQMLERGRQANELERQRMLAELRQEVARLVVATSAKVLDRELTADDRQSINKRAAEQLAANN
jgi:F-type H+-transporting ATPase subunit b